MVLMMLGGISYPKAVLRVLMGLILYGAVIEMAQFLTGYRNGDLYDWYADSIGAVVTAVLCNFLLRKQT
jgi:VanZ family protein